MQLKSIYIILAIIFLLLIWAIQVYNRIVGMVQRIENSKAQIDTLLKKRFDMIPNMVQIVKGYAAHEKETLLGLIEIRNKTYDDKNVVKKDKVCNKTFSKIMAISEAYPELKASENFLKLQIELDEMEDLIRTARMEFNDVVLIYNRFIMAIPTVFIAILLGYKREEYFEADMKERENVKMSLPNE